MKRVITGRGKNLTDIEVNDGVDDDTLAAALLGPSGNLKAPTLKVGTTLLVGFNENAYQQVLGG
jgi:hypothetical protein